MCFRTMIIRYARLQAKGRYVSLGNLFALEPFLVVPALVDDSLLYPFTPSARLGANLDTAAVAQAVSKPMGPGRRGSRDGAA